MTYVSSVLLIDVSTYVLHLKLTFSSQGILYFPLNIEHKYSVTKQMNSPCL